MRVQVGHNLFLARTAGAWRETRPAQGRNSQAPEAGAHRLRTREPHPPDTRLFSSSRKLVRTREVEGERDKAGSKSICMYAEVKVQMRTLRLTGGLRPRSRCSSPAGACHAAEQAPAAATSPTLAEAVVTLSASVPGLAGSRGAALNSRRKRRNEISPRSGTGRAAGSEQD